MILSICNFRLSHLLRLIYLTPYPLRDRRGRRGEVASFKFCSRSLNSERSGIYNPKMAEINENEVYTTTETQELLKISSSTIKRMLKKGLIRANKVGGQYRILGKEILRVVSPAVEKEAEKAYMKVKRKVVEVLNKW